PAGLGAPAAYGHERRSRTGTRGCSSPASGYPANATSFAASGIIIPGGVSVSEVLDLIIVGGGPCGLACAVAARRRGLSHLILEKGPFLNTLVRFPETMTFFSSAELLEIGDIPFSLPHLRPTRAEGIAYFRKVAQHENVQMRTYE